MTAEIEVRPRRSALAAATAWQTLELPPELRRGVEAAAKAAGIEPEAWLTRVVLAAAAPPEPEPIAPRKPDAEVARSLATLLSAARARSRERHAEASALTLVEPAPDLEEPPPEIARTIRLTAERPDEEPSKQLPTLYYAPPQPGRHILALALLTITVGAAVGAGAFYVRYGGAPPAAEPALTAALPPSTPPGGPAPAAAPAAPSSIAPVPAVSSPPASQPVPASSPAPPSTPPPQPASVAPPASAPTATASVPAKDASSPPPPPPPIPESATPAPSPPAPAASPAPPPAATTAALPPPGGPRVPAPTAPTESVIQDYNLGVRYAFGTGVKQDYKKAAELFLKAAMQGLPDAQYNLGALYDNGLGVPKDPVRAVIWYHSAAEQQHPSAELNLGLAYANGTGVAQDYAEAARWFRRAADQGVVTAQYNLAALYANGRGVEQSSVDAYAWFNIAAAAGDLEARDQMQRAAGTMSPQQLRTARTLAIKLAEGVRRPIPGSDAKTPALGSSQQTANPQTASAGAPAAPSALAQPIDKAQVAEIQRYLARLQFDPGAPTGVLTDKTAEAIRQYQTDRKLKVDGEANRALLFRLKADIERLQKR
jgi:Putative peptidoglycan binding domain/Sel1 repeat